MAVTKEEKKAKQSIILNNLIALRNQSASLEPPSNDELLIKLDELIKLAKNQSHALYLADCLVTFPLGTKSDADYKKWLRSELYRVYGEVNYFKSQEF